MSSTSLTNLSHFKPVQLLSKPCQRQYWQHSCKRASTTKVFARSQQDDSNLSRLELEVPVDQRPVNELNELKNSPLFSWVRLTCTLEYCIILLLPVKCSGYPDYYYWKNNHPLSFSLTLSFSIYRQLWTLIVTSNDLASSTAAFYLSSVALSPTKHSIQHDNQQNLY